MRMFAYLDSYTTVDGFALLRFPCAGVLKNISFQINVNATEVNDQDNWRVVLGDVNVSNLMSQTPLVDDSFSIMRSAREKNMVIIQGIDYFDEALTATNTGNYFYHSGKTINIRHDRDYILGIFGTPASNGVKVFVQGEFYPRKNAYTKFKYLFDGLDDGDNWTLEYVIPTGLRNAVLEYDIYVKDTEGTEIAAKIHPRIRPWNQTQLVNATGIKTGVGVVDGSEAIAGDIVYGNSIDDFIIGTASSGIASSQGVLPIRDIIRAGDVLTFDITNLTGDISNAEEFTASFTLHGRATGEPTMTRSHFLDSNVILQPTKEVFE